MTHQQKACGNWRNLLALLSLLAPWALSCGTLPTPTVTPTITPTITPTLAPLPTSALP